MENRCERNVNWNCSFSSPEWRGKKFIAYESPSNNKAEWNYCTTRKELLAVVYFVRQFKQYLLGNKLLIWTDHADLTWLQHASDLMGQQGRWQERLQKYNFDIKHCPTNKHGNADALSGKPCGKPGCCLVEVNMNHRRKQEAAWTLLQAVAEIFNEVCCTAETDAVGVRLVVAKKQETTSGRVIDRASDIVDINAGVSERNSMIDRTTNNVHVEQEIANSRVVDSATGNIGVSSVLESQKLTVWSTKLTMSNRR